MMSRHFRLSSELTGAIAKKLPHAKNQLSGPDSFFNQFVTDIYILYTSALHLLALRGLRTLRSRRVALAWNYSILPIFGKLFNLYKYSEHRLTNKGVTKVLSPFIFAQI